MCFCHKLSYEDLRSKGLCDLNAISKILQLQNVTTGVVPLPVTLQLLHNPHMSNFYERQEAHTPHQME